MKIKAILVSCILCCLLNLTPVSAQEENVYPTVLVELFSSEGCSSCPVADNFLKEIITLSDSTRSPVFCLDFHVDIWNRSGWVDSFSDTSFSRRQREYMVKTKQLSLFTPMMFVNGEGALPGAAKKEIGKLINNGMSTMPKTTLSTKAGYVSQTNTLLVDYDISGITDSCTFNMVLAYKEIKSEITGGENAGQMLVHHHTAKVWKSVPIDPSKKGTVTLKLPEGIPLSNLMLVNFVQHGPTWKIYATDQLSFR